jgi:RND family efflux transporter MFP subunit
MRSTRLFVVLSALLLLAGCGGPAPQVAPTAPPVVTFLLPVEESRPEFEYFDGHTAAVEMVDVRARVSGYLEKVLFKPGAEVKQGELLFVIDPRPYRAELERAESQVAQAQARFERLTRDYERAQRAGVGTAVSREEFEKILGDRAEAEASLKAAKANVEKYRLDLGFTQMHAPIAGRVSRNLLTVGNLVNQDQTLLTTIVSVDPMHVYFDVAERVALRLQKLIREGKIKSARETQVPVEMGLSIERGYPHQGMIDFVDNKINPSTGTIQVRALFPNPETAGKSRVLSPGLFTRVRMAVGEPHKVLLVPERVLGTDQGQKYLYVVNDKNEVERRNVGLGSLQDGKREVTSGLKPGERVILDGLQRVRPGVAVDPKPAGAQSVEPPKA